MTSMRKLNRRLLRWQRYEDRPRCTLGPPTAPSTCYCTNRPGCPYDGGDDYCASCDNPTCEGDCDEDYDCLSSLECPCGGACWDDLPPERPVETVTIRGGLL